jgi:hypothetical protein
VVAGPAFGVSFMRREGGKRMLLLRKASIGVVGLVLALGFGVSTAKANLNLDEVAAALALPVLTGSAALPLQTNIVVTNASSSGVTLVINVLSGDPGENCESASFSCHVTARETTLFTYINNGNGTSTVTFECSAEGANANSPFGDLNIPRAEVVSAENGIMWIALEDPADGQTTLRNAIFGDAVVFDGTLGVAHAVGAVPFQGRDALAPGRGDRQYRFDDVEYAAFPSVLASNFIAPIPGILSGDLVLFTLDLTIGGFPPPRSRLKVNFYDDDEKVRNNSHEFTCFDIVALTTVDPRFGTLGSQSGHLDLTPQPTSALNTAHDGQFGTADGVRNTPVHGWLTQTVLLPGGPGAWARTLAQSTIAHTPFGTDVPVLNAQ